VIDGVDPILQSMAERHSRSRVQDLRGGIFVSHCASGSTSPRGSDVPQCSRLISSGRARARVMENVLPFPRPFGPPNIAKCHSEELRAGQLLR
jgi:hypothetical protein